jgi:hypothetical protein
MLFTDHPPNENLITNQSLSRKPEHPIDTQHVAASLQPQIAFDPLSSLRLKCSALLICC